MTYFKSKTNLIINKKEDFNKHQVVLTSQHPLHA